ncbi:MAG: DUF4922 domain-containing protein [Prevotella sp.]|nr:DUF4922 domain-containing protein [Prevotella sp.]MDY6130412.1 DUF4922 domain-containing protein [Prevotella sp.]
MRERIDCFLPCENLAGIEHTLEQLRRCYAVQHIYLMVNEEFANRNEEPTNSRFLKVDGLLSTDTVRKVEEKAHADYTLLYLKTSPLKIGLYGLHRMLNVAVDTGAAMVYSDRYSMEDGVAVKHPVIAYQLGSLRDDFDFGSLLLIKSSLLHEYVAESTLPDYSHAGLYDLRLFLSRKGDLFHVNEFLYTEEELDLRESGAKQFDYVNPANRNVQVEMERAVTAHLKKIGAFVDTLSYCIPDFNEQKFECEASVIIPVFNREKTICDAVNSALEQETDFVFNVIVVDNHSTDRTTQLLNAYNDKRLVHIIPDRQDLGIGGCWNLAVNDDRCGRFSVQLDSDDLYSSPHTLQQIVDAFHQQQAAMVIGAYRMCDFDLNTLPPGLVSHAEWTEENGCNNALRINGLGAPRAFFTPLLRQMQLPNTSYGEDYAAGLAFSRKYRIGRIFTELYLCRRWGGNSDAALSVDKVNANNLYKDRLRTIELKARMAMMNKTGRENDYSLLRFFNRQLEKWDAARHRYYELQNVNTKTLPASGITLKAQFNPARMVSTGASITPKAIAERPCFLCEKNRPEQQIAKEFGKDFQLLVNPFPILPAHFTIPLKAHQPQNIWTHYGEMYRLLEQYPQITVFYNGPKCGASAPDHMHFQAGTSGQLPLQEGWQRLGRNLTPILENNTGEGIYFITEYPSPALLIKSREAKSDKQMFACIYKALEQEARETDGEPMMNIVAWKNQDEHLSVVFLRKKHRPDCYTAEGEVKMMVSPGALDMAGLLIVPCQEDFHKITAEQAIEILKEVSLTEEETERVVSRLRDMKDCLKNENAGQTEKAPEVQVGIVSAESIGFSLNSPYMAKGELIEGTQSVSIAEGTILWNGNQYHELRFMPKDKNASFSIKDVTIGVNFHWERKETQTFQGALRLVVEADKICAINELPVENYLTSVISSEMKATSSLEFLKAHAVISRSWLLAQVERRKKQGQGGNGFFSFVKKEDELIRWYDRDDHTIFDVCADDHCQRYQGITKANNRHVEEAVKATKGQILVYGGEICDARFSKCCGGVTEEFRYCWEDADKPYLVSIRDAANNREEPFCNTKDKNILSQVLNDYDQETADFYRWHVEYTQQQIRELIESKLKLTVGDIVALEPLEKGKSGRISKLKIVGTERSFTIGKELEIRRTLSESHLYSSAFDVETQDVENGIPGKFILNGSGWGHGVGLCQIGAAVMGERGYRYDEILLHYYRGAEIKKKY